MRYILILILFGSLEVHGQWKSYILSVKGDTLNRVDMRGLKQGPWFIHVDDLRGERGYDEQGYFTDDKKEGVWKRFSLDGDMLAIETYRYGFKDGKSVYFNNMGDMLREEHWRAIDPKNPYDTVSVYDVNDPSKVIGKKVIKVEAASYKNGTWTYYNPATGTIDKTEEWVMDKAKNRAATNDELAPIGVGNDSSIANSNDKKQTAKPREVLEFEKKNSGRKKVRVRDGSTGGL
jgi:hypothetical protein